MRQVDLLEKVKTSMSMVDLGVWSKLLSEVLYLSPAKCSIPAAE
jgi:hypothetical protein